MKRTNERNRARLTCEAFESRVVPAVFPLSAGAVAISPDDGGIPKVKIVDSNTGEDIGEIQAYEDAFRGGVRVALGDVTGDGVRDVVIAPGAGGGPRIRIVDGQSGKTLNDFFVYEPSFTGGISISLGDIDGDGRDDIITGTGKGGGPRVRVLDGATLGEDVLKDFFAYEDSFRGGVLVSSGDTNGDGRDDIVTGTGIGGGPRVQVFSGVDDRVLRNEFAYEDSFRGGVLVATGDTNDDGRDDIICGTGPGGGPVVRVLSGDDGRELSSLFADDSSFRGGVRVDARDVDGDGDDDVIARVRIGNDDALRFFDGATGSFLRSISRVVDDNPSPSDLIPGSGSGVVSGVATYIEGTLVSVDATAGTATIQLRNGTTATAQAGPGTEIKRDKLRVGLATFVVGDKVEALIGPNGIAWEIEAKSPAFQEGQSGRDDDSDDDSNDDGSNDDDSNDDDGSNDDDNGVEVEGFIVAIDPSAGTVSIRSRSGTEVIVTANLMTKIERNDAHTTLAAFQVGDFGEADVGTDGFATKIEAVQL